eukprot:TRINITY_DN22851_c0_g1_i2.p1 TRINITY_DN22851_c0_g1~~TRINITY_DN22851_c0_g1_i2.p1  ORF type:complete len:157 (+),score=20.42 TRINITY_DN22851_c0_g1_i2:23-472(+)
MAEATDVDAALLPRKGFIIMHMNLDHANSLKAYARHYGKVTSAENVILTELDSRGMTLSAELEDKSWKTGIYVPFPEPLKSAGAIRQVVVEMHKEAFEELGWKRPEDTLAGKLQHLTHHVSTRAQLAAIAAVLATTFFLFSRRYKISRI